MLPPVSVEQFHDEIREALARVETLIDEAERGLVPMLERLHLDEYREDHATLSNYVSIKDPSESTRIVWTNGFIRRKYLTNTMTFGEPAQSVPVVQTNDRIATTVDDDIGATASMIEVGTIDRGDFERQLIVTVGDPAAPAAKIIVYLDRESRLRLRQALKS